MEALRVVRPTLLLLTSALLLSACLAAGSPGTTADAGTAVATTPEPEASGSSASLPAIATEFPNACEVLSADELAGAVGNAVADGVGLTNLICDWEGAAEETSVALLLQPVPADLCVDALPEGATSEQFGGPGAIAYDFAGNIPSAQAGVCIGPGLVLVTVTGGFGAESDEARYTEEAAAVMEMVLDRL